MKISLSHFHYFFIFLSLPMVLVSCSSTRSFELSLNQDAFVSDSDKEAKLYPKGSSIQVNPKSYTLIESPGHLSVMIPPAETLPEKLKVSLKPVSSWGQEMVKKQVDDQLIAIFDQVNEVQTLLGQRQADKALTKVEMLEGKYPGLISVKYLKVRTLLALNRKRDARRELASSEEEFQQSDNGRKLINFFKKNNKQDVFENENLGEDDETNK